MRFFHRHPRKCLTTQRRPPQDEEAEAEVGTLCPDFCANFRVPVLLRLLSSWRPPLGVW